METRRLQFLLELARLGSMRAVADEMHVTTSTVSQQIAVLAREVGATLVEPVGRRVRLTPAGRRLAEHAVTIQAAVEAARLDLDPGTEPAGTLRVAGFATAVRGTLLPIAADIAVDRPGLRLLFHEHEPDEAFALLAGDRVDLALVYDYSLAPAPFDPALAATPLWTTPWSLAVPTGAATPTGTAPAVFAAHRDRDWIVNSRGTADERVVRTMASMAGFEPRIVQRIDSLDLVQDMIAGGFGVGLLPADQPVRPGVELLPLHDPDVVLRSYAVIRRGRADWPPLALVLRLLTGRALDVGGTERGHLRTAERGPAS
ncbi:LysR family transcriptional regulator [Pseudonocardia humida]|uniref:LysR family transcriptional regulator n=1 Tax=Pseudonocardia humida TaxID=2800819 RepID=A0ABT1A7X3_9PSEU|nr:LysR family transcriptional regulator [Pseudonocardia humida]MCO1659130.1 LysR family transcriptional regulator [Pseudonocardia humida]